MKRSLPPVIALLWLAAALPGRADDTDIFVISGVEPNVLILLDSSGSMNDPIDGVPKIDIAKQVVTSLVSSTPSVRFGVMKFRSNGGQLVAAIGTSTATVVSAVNGMTTTSVGTPLGDQLWEAGEYFKGNGSYTSPIQFACQLNMVVVVSDGLQNSSTRDIRDEATSRFVQDHAAGFGGSQNVIVHTVGFGIAASEAVAANAILQEAATNGGGNFYSTDSGSELATSLQLAVQMIVAATYSFAAPLVPSTGVTGSDRAYQAAFLSDPVRPFWRGYLSAFDRDADGQVPTDADGVPLDSALAWEAGQALAGTAASSRTIFTSVAGAKESFTTANATITAAMLGVPDATARAKLIDFVRGVDTFDEDGDANTTEQRLWKLGDILHSSPVLVSTPPLVSGDPTYQAFKQAQANRTPVLIVGVNDGMLHGFRESDGVELWGFIPPDQLARLEQLTPASGVHTYFVDSSPVAVDVLVSGAYKTIVVFGERRGGRRYHALDVTDTTNPGVLWSFSDAGLGETWSVPAIGRVKMADSTTVSVAFVGGGYDTAANNATGKAIYAIDLATGAKIWEYRNDGSGGDRQYMNFSLAAGPTAVDTDGDGFLDRVYGGDVGGQLWKFDVSAPATTTAGLVDNWPGKRLFAASPGQPNPPPAGAYQPAQAIYAAPAVARDDLGTLWVYFGTGDLNRPTAASQNRFYGLRDDTDMVNGNALTEISLVDVTTTDATGGNGWYFRLEDDEKVLAGADVFDRTVYFTTFKPEPTTSCSSDGGPARLYAVETASGYAALDWANGERLEPTNSSETRYTEVGSGIPSEPLVVANDSGGVLDTAVVTGTTAEQLEGTTVPSVSLRQVLYWREVF